MPEISRWEEIRRHMVRSLKNGWKLYSQSKFGIAGLALILFFAFLAVAAPILTPYTPDFEAPPQDALKAYLYAFDVSQNIYGMAIGYTQLYAPNLMTGGDWILLNHGTSIEGIYVQNPALVGTALNKSVANMKPWETTNLNFTLTLDSIKGIGSDENITHLIYASPSTSDLQLHYNGPGQNPYFDGEIIFTTQKHLVIYDIYNLKNSSYNRYMVINLNFEPKWLVEDVTSEAQLTSAVLYNYTMQVYPLRFIMVGDEHHLQLFYQYYTYSNDPHLPPIENCVKLIMNKTYSDKIIYTPLLFFNGNLYDSSPNKDGNIIVVPTENNTILYKGFDRKMIYPVPIPGQPPVQVYPKLMEKKFNFTLTAPPGFYPSAQDLGSNPILLPVKDGNIAKLYVVRAKGDSKGIPVIDERLTMTLGVGEIHAAPQIYKAGDNLTVYVTKYDPSTGHSYLYKFRGTLSRGFIQEHFVDKKGNKLENIKIPAADVKRLLYVEENNQLFFLTRDMKLLILDLHQYLSSGYVEIGRFSYYTPEGKRGVFPYPPGSKLSQFIFVGSLQGSRYRATTASFDIYGGYYCADTKTVGLVLLKGESQLPLPPGRYPSGNFYFLGTDDKGHDLWTWLVYGARVAFIVGILAAFVQVMIGSLYGVISGYRGGWVDTVMMRFADIMLTIPFLPIVLILTSILGPSIWNIILVLGVFGWAGISRVIRAQTLSLKARPFVDAAKVAGASRWRIMVSHILPNVLPFAFLYMTIGVAGAILTEAALSYLGLGDPRAVSWGQMLYSIQTAGATMYAWWWLLPPGFSITLISLGFYLVGRAFDEILNPRLRKR